MYNLKDIFNSKKDSKHDSSLQALIDNQLKESDAISILRPGIKNTSHMMKVIDLGGRCYVVNETTQLKMIDGIIISNGCIVAGPNFPLDQYIFSVEGANTIKFENLIIECQKEQMDFI